MPKVSVIIPNYNHAAYLRQRINSVLDQTYRDFELIILDDFSTDNSREIIESYRGHEKISHIAYNETNGGSTFKQWEKGIALANAEWIWIAESDDFCEKTFLEEMLAVQQQNHLQKGMIFCDSVYVDGSSTPIAGKEPPTIIGNYVGPVLAISQVFLTQNGVPNTSAVIFHKSAFTEFGPMCAHFKLNGDWWLWSAIAAKDGIYYLPLRLNFFRFHGHTARTKFSSSGINILEYGRLIHLWQEWHMASAEDLQKALWHYHALWIGSRALTTRRSLDIWVLGRSLEKKLGHKTKRFTYPLFLKSRIHRFLHG